MQLRHHLLTLSKGGTDTTNYFVVWWEYCSFDHFPKVSANPKQTVLHNFGFLYDSLNIRNSFRFKKIHLKNILFVQEAIERKQFCCLNYSNQPLTIHAIALSNKERLHDSKAHGVTKHTQKLSSCEILKTKKNDCVPFLSSKPRPKKGRKHFAVNRQQS